MAWQHSILIGIALLSVGWRGFKEKQLSTSQSYRPSGWLGFFYFVVLPYLLVLMGLITPRHLGLKGLHYFTMGPFFDFSIARLQRATLLMLTEWIVDSQVIIPLSLITFLILGTVMLNLANYGLLTSFIPPSLHDTIYDTLHWSFYRAIFWAVTDDIYLGILLGVALVLLEWGLMAWLRNGWASQQTIMMMILLLTALLFFYRSNLWLIGIIHWLMILLIQKIQAKYTLA